MSRGDSWPYVGNCEGAEEGNLVILLTKLVIRVSYQSWLPELSEELIAFISILACSRFFLFSYAESKCVACAFRNFLTTRQRLLGCARSSLPLTVGEPELLQLARQLVLACPFFMAIRVQPLHKLESIVENRFFFCIGTIFVCRFCLNSTYILTHH